MPLFTKDKKEKKEEEKTAPISAPRVSRVIQRLYPEGHCGRCHMPLAIERPLPHSSPWAGNEIYLYEVLATNLLQAMLVRRAEQSHRQSSNSAVRACYAHIHRSSIALRCSQTTRPRGQMTMWPNSERKPTSKWPAFTIHRSSIASRCSQTTQSPPSLLN